MACKWKGLSPNGGSGLKWADDSELAVNPKPSHPQNTIYVKNEITCHGRLDRFL